MNLKPLAAGSPSLVPNTGSLLRIFTLHLDSRNSMRIILILEQKLEKMTKLCFFYGYKNPRISLALLR